MSQGGGIYLIRFYYCIGNCPYPFGMHQVYLLYILIHKRHFAGGFQYRIGLLGYFFLKIFCYFLVGYAFFINYLPFGVHQYHIGAFEMQVYSKVEWVHKRSSFANLLVSY